MCKQWVNNFLHGSERIYVDMGVLYFFIFIVNDVLTMSEECG